MGSNPCQITVFGQNDKSDKMTDVFRNIKKRGVFSAPVWNKLHKLKKIFKKSLYFNNPNVKYFT